MNGLTIILALYLLGLSLWPCADECPPVMGQEQESYVVLTSASLPQSGQSHEHHDQCTPFCTCACCAVTITLITQFTYSLAPSIAVSPRTVTAFHYIPLQWADPLSAIWQPPKIRV